MYPRRREILGFLARRNRMGEETPSEREIGRAVGLRSSQTVHHHLLALEVEGYLERTPPRGPSGSRTTKRRTIRLTEKGWGVVGTAPLLGRIAAGRGLEAVAEGEAYSLGGELLDARSGRQRYLLRVVGDSMIGAHIGHGDLLVVEEDDSPADGEIVVALLRGGEEVTVKRLRREGDTVRLEPRNGEHEDIVVPAEDVVVQGKVVWVIHPPRR